MREGASRASTSISTLRVSALSCLWRCRILWRRRCLLFMCPGPTVRLSSAPTLCAGRQRSMLSWTSLSPLNLLISCPAPLICRSSRLILSSRTRSRPRKGARAGTRCALCLMAASRSEVSPTLIPGLRLCRMRAGACSCTYVLWRTLSCSPSTSTTRLSRCPCPPRAPSRRGSTSRFLRAWTLRLAWFLSWIGRWRVPGKRATSGSSICVLFFAGGVLCRWIQPRPYTCVAPCLLVTSRCLLFRLMTSRLLLSLWLSRRSL
mmetsp:Transcript_12211/g.21773  ORF Transcript_12211/g.21773 Transcript_12211/m.21773 type:complete len:261 (-) Transcript_12211:290-1072(-)